MDKDGKKVRKKGEKAEACHMMETTAAKDDKAAAAAAPMSCCKKKDAPKADAANET